MTVYPVEKSEWNVENINRLQKNMAHLEPHSIFFNFISIYEPQNGIQNTHLLHRRKTNVYKLMKLKLTSSHVSVPVVTAGNLLHIVISEKLLIRDLQTSTFNYCITTGRFRPTLRVRNKYYGQERGYFTGRGKEKSHVMALEVVSSNITYTRRLT